MVKRICDRCGENVFAYYNMKIIRRTPMLVTEIADYDLCDDCWKDFMRFLEQKPLLKREKKNEN